MAKKSRLFGALTTAAGMAVLGIGAVLAAPTAAALPECVNTAPNTTQCTTNGSNSITTSPPLNQNNSYGGYPFLGGWSGFVVGLG
jgi:hypothetical protein